MLSLPATVNTGQPHLALAQEYTQDKVFSGREWLTPSITRLLKIDGPTN